MEHVSHFSYQKHNCRVSVLRTRVSFPRHYINVESCDTHFQPRIMQKKHTDSTLGTDPRIVDDYVNYAKFVISRYDEYVPIWYTFNEREPSHPLSILNHH